MAAYQSTSWFIRTLKMIQMFNQKYKHEQKLFSEMKDKAIIPVVHSSGSGTRLWSI